MTSLAIFLGFIPSFAWLAFFLHEDYRHPEPARMLILAFFLGAAATFLAFWLELKLDYYLNLFNIDRYSTGSFLSFAFIEEIFKFCLVLIFISQSRYFDEPIDAMIYMIVAALGFAAVENIGAAVNQWQTYLELEPVVHAITLRFIGATLLHSLAAATIGYYWAQGLRQKSLGLFIIEGLLWASLLHAIFNYLIINTGAIIIPTMFLLIIGLFILHDFEKVKRFVYPTYFSNRSY